MKTSFDARSESATALFFHGMNNFKDDNLHLGPVHLGRMDRFIKPELTRRGVTVYTIDGIGFGSPESQARHASTQIQGFEIKEGSTIQLLGNSTGGLVIRELARLWHREPALNPQRLRIGKLISWGTPHFGAFLASLPVIKNHPTFRHYTPEAMIKFNKLHPMNEFAPEFYFLCAANWREVSPYFWGFYHLIHAGSFAEAGLRTDAASDGFIPAESQKWGESRGTFSLDHFGQTGFHSILPLPLQRQKAKSEFARLCDKMAELINES